MRSLRREGPVQIEHEVHDYINSVTYFLDKDKPGAVSRNQIKPHRRGAEIAEARRDFCEFFFASLCALRVSAVKESFPAWKGSSRQ